MMKDAVLKFFVGLITIIILIAIGFLIIKFPTASVVVLLVILVPFALFLVGDAVLKVLKEWL
jgi:hypothetical protein